ncbi:MAG: hypothetical protein ABW252_24800 [Polyangiales bacterium]
MYRPWTVLLLPLCLAACGRVGLEILPAPDAGGPDATPLPDVDQCGVSGSTPASLDDSSCDGIDDDCDGVADEAFVDHEVGCGTGACAARGTVACEAGRLVDSCVPGEPLAQSDDLTRIGVDDDCDGLLDEDAARCGDDAQLAFGPGAYPNIVVPSGCGHVTVRLWGGAGAAGARAGVFFVAGGSGGAGGYAANTVAVSGALALYVGQGAPNCDGAGELPGAGSFGGGVGGTAEGTPGVGTLAGGHGGAPALGFRGGDGFYGGGGGGQGRGGLGESGRGGGGGAASGLFSGGNLVALAGGGGGGGGAQVVSVLGAIYTAPGGAGGSGCGGHGDGTEDSGGGGGGGGACIGTTQMGSSSRTPVLAAELPVNTAVGGRDSCEAGGNGFAIVQFRQ